MHRCHHFTEDMKSGSRKPVALIDEFLDIWIGMMSLLDDGGKNKRTLAEHNVK